MEQDYVHWPPPLSRNQAGLDYYIIIILYNSISAHSIFHLYHPNPLTSPLLQEVKKMLVLSTSALQHWRRALNLLKCGSLGKRIVLGKWLQLEHCQKKKKNRWEKAESHSRYSQRCLSHRGKLRLRSGSNRITVLLQLVPINNLNLYYWLFWDQCHPCLQTKYPIPSLHHSKLKFFQNYLTDVPLGWWEVWGQICNKFY